MLYSPEFLNQLPAAGPHETSALLNLNTHRPRVLHTVNRWFDELYPNGNADLASRLRGNATSQFVPALYELLIHRYFSARGWAVRRDYRIDGGNPDFYIPDIDWPIEVTALGESENEHAENGVLDDVCRSLEKVKSDFWISIFGFHFKRIPIDTRKVVLWVEQQLEEHETGQEFEAAYVFDDGESHIDFVFGRKGMNARGNVGAKGMYTYDFELSKARILARLRSKARKYGRDMLIFLCTGAGFWSIRAESLDECLYGEYLVSFNREISQRRDQRCPNGFFSKLVQGVPRNTRVAAVVACERRIVDETNDEIGLSLTVYHNPYARRRLDVGVFSDVRQFALVLEDDRSVTLGWVTPKTEPVKL